VADSSGQADFAKIELGVLRSIAETLGQNETRRETIENSIEGQTLVLDIALDGQDVAARLQRADTAAVTMQVYAPDGSAYFDSPVAVTTQTSQVQITNAEAGSWSYDISNSSTQSAGYSMSVASAGTGVITGLVLDAENSTGISGATVSTNGGGLSISVDGYYILMHSAGVFTVEASEPSYSSASRQVTLAAGETRDVSLMLSSASSSTTDNGSSTDNETRRKCLARSLFSEKNHAADFKAMRRFRDDYLRNSLAGRRLVALYYRASAELAALVEQDRRLQSILCERLRGLLPMIRRLQIQGSGSVEPDVHAYIKCSLQKLQRSGSGRLDSFIADFRRHYAVLR
ncbi:MAG: carboxypeptidase-like regulatory domain-containing protein, partial [Deltaproteobacteria bacterium]|nr:carboxypeptidase-like regulatory domain-containing protein [Deltaproteobacteria bacterium]